MKLTILVSLFLVGLILACVDSPSMSAFLWSKVAAAAAFLGALYHLPRG